MLWHVSNNAEINSLFIHSKNTTHKKMFLKNIQKIKNAKIKIKIIKKGLSLHG